MTGQFYDAESVSLSSTDWTPTVSGKSFARALSFAGAGTVKVDCLGVGGGGGQTAQTFTVAVAQVLQLAVTKVYKTGTTATGIQALY